MWKKIKRAVTDNFPLKLLAFGFAVALWIIVVNVDDPDQTRTFTATVQVINENVLTEQGKYYTIVDNNNTVSFRVTAQRSILERLSSSDFTATADMRNLEDNKRIPVDITVNRYASSVTISTQRLYLEVDVGDEMETKFIIRGETTGTPAEGCAVDEVTVSPNVISVTGPAEAVAQIDSVRAVCDVSNINTDITESVIPVCYDASGNVVDTTRLELSLSTVDISVRIVNTKEVPIEVNTSGSLGPGLELDKITTDPATVVIKGDRASLNAITSIEIPASVIQLSEITQNLTTTVDITSYLPEGVTLVDPNDSQVKVTVSVLGTVSRQFEIPTANLTVRNLGRGYSAAFNAQTVNVTIKALQSQLSAITAETITGYVDASGLAPGTHTVPIILDLDSDYEVTNTPIQITITE